MTTVTGSDFHIPEQPEEAPTDVRDAIIQHSFAVALSKAKVLPRVRAKIETMVQQHREQLIRWNAKRLSFLFIVLTNAVIGV